MKKTFQSLIITMAVICLLIIGAGAASAAEVKDQGTCGPSVTWVLYDDGQLIISGTGKMTSSPWKDDYDETIRYVTIEEGVTSVADNAFYSCNNIESVVIPDSVTLIGNTPFAGCDALEDVTITTNASPVETGSCLFGSGVNSLKTITYTGTGSINLFNSGNMSATTVNIGSGVRSIDKEAFDFCNNITSLVIPDTVKTIGCQFRACGKLKSLSLPTNAQYTTSWIWETIPKIIFTGTGTVPDVCSESVTEVIIGENVTGIADSAFHYCDSLEQIVIPAKVTTIGANAFESCTKLSEITIPSGVTSIGEGAFMYCTGLSTITIPAGVNNIAASTFAYCTGLTEIVIPNTVTSIGDEAFSGCTNVTSIDMTDSIDSYGSDFFDGITATVNYRCLKGNIKSELEQNAGGTLIWNEIHPWKADFEVDQQPTCTAAGSKSIHCEHGDKTKDVTSIPALGHAWSHVTNPGSFLQNGSEYDQCTRCGAQQNNVVLPGYATSYVKGMKVSKGKGAITVKWKKQKKNNLKKFKGYQIQVATDPGFTNIVKSVNAGKKSKSKKIKGLAKKTQYYVQMRTYTVSGGAVYYSPWTMKSVKTK